MAHDSWLTNLDNVCIQWPGDGEIVFDIKSSCVQAVEIENGLIGFVRVLEIRNQHSIEPFRCI